MIKDERHEKIIQFVNQKKFISVQELREYLGISKATIRRDLDALSESKQILLSRGGARCIQEPQRELPYDEKRKVLQEEKIRICKAACEHIQEGNIILVDTGTTTREMIPFLLEKKHIHVITNDILIACELAANCDIEITVTGGSVRTGFYTLKGYAAETFLGRVHVDIAFLSMDAVDGGRGVMITNMDEITIKQTIIGCADYVIALCDHLKFQKSALCRVCGLEAVDQFITGKELSQDICGALEAKGAQIKTV